MVRGHLHHVAARYGEAHRYHEVVAHEARVRRGHILVLEGARRILLGVLVHQLPQAELDGLDARGEVTLHGHDALFHNILNRPVVVPGPIVQLDAGSGVIM